MSSLQAVEMAFCMLTQGLELLEEAEDAYSQAGPTRAV